MVVLTQALSASSLCYMYVHYDICVWCHTSALEHPLGTLRIWPGVRPLGPLEGGENQRKTVKMSFLTEFS